MSETDMLHKYCCAYGALNRGVILLLLIGSHYYAFGECADTAAPIVGLTVRRYWNTIQMFFSEEYLDLYLARLVRTKKTVAIAVIDDGNVIVTRLVKPGRVTWI